MLQYIFEHTVDVLRNIDLPEDIEEIHHLSLTSNSVRQLNVVNNYSYYKGKNDYWHSNPQPEPVKRSIWEKITSKQLVKGDGYCDRKYNWGTLRFPGTKTQVMSLLTQLKKDTCKELLYFDLVYNNGEPTKIAILNEWEI